MTSMDKFPVKSNPAAEEWIKRGKKFHQDDAGNKGRSQRCQIFCAGKVMLMKKAGQCSRF